MSYKLGPVLAWERACKAGGLPATFPMTTTKATLATVLFEQLGLNKSEAGDMVDHFFEEIATELAAGEFVKLSGFGNFSLREKPPHPGRNPKTGQPIPILARRVVTFHASSKLKSLIKPPAALVDRDVASTIPTPPA